MIGLRLRAVCLFLLLVIPLAGGWPLLAQPASSTAPTGPAAESARAGPDTLWQIQTVDSAGDVGWDTSTAVDAAGKPHVSYCEYGPYMGGWTCYDLKYAHQEEATWSIETVDSGGYIGAGNSLALDSQGHPHIAYGQYDCFSGCLAEALRYAHYDGAAWQVEIVDSAGYVGAYASLALDSQDRPHISYFADDPHNDLRYAYYDGSTWITETVVSEGYVGTSTALALDSQGRPRIAYFEETGDYLYYAWHDGSAWHQETIDDTNQGGYASLALDTQDSPHVSYYDLNNQQVKHAWNDGTGWAIETLETGIGFGGGLRTSITLDALDRPRVVYHIGPYRDDLRYAWYDGNSWHLEEVDTAGDVGAHASMALDALDQPHVAYADDTNADLKYAFAPCVALEGLAIAGPPTLPTGIIGLYTATYTPTDTTFPELAWDNGATGPTAGYSWTVPGTYTVVATATNPCSQVLDTYTVTTFCQPPTGIVVQGSRFPYATVDSAYQVSALPITASTPLTFTWDNGTVGSTTVYSWTLPGIYTQTITATNPCTSLGGSFTVTVRCLPVQEVDCTWTPLTPTVGQTVVLTGTANGVGIRWITTTLDPGTTPYVHPSLAMDGSNRPHISYYHPDHQELRYAHFDGMAWHTATVETDVDFGMESATSLALDAAGRPHISYQDQPGGGLKYARYDGADWHTETVQSGWYVGSGNSLALDAAGLPHISYADSGWLRYAWYDGSSWHSERISQWEDYPYTTALELDSAGRPHIAYYAAYPNWLMYTWHDGSDWQSQIVRLQGGYGRVSMALDADERPHITCVYNDLVNVEPMELLYLWFDSTTWHSETIDVMWQSGWYTSLELDSLDRPHIAYSKECDQGTSSAPSEVRHAFHDGAAWQIETVDGAGDWTALALDALDRPYVAYGRQGLHYAWLEPGPLTPPVSYTWALGDGHLLQGEVVEHIYTQPGTYTVALTASNCQGAGWATATHTLVALPCEPVHDAAFSWSPLTPTVNQWTAFHATAGGEAPIIYRWAFGDGGYGGGANISHRYTDSGVYTVLLTATNCVSDAMTVAHTLTVVLPLCEPVHNVSFDWAPLTPTVGAAVAFTATVSGTEPLAFTWDFGDGGTAYGFTTTHVFTAAGAQVVTVTVVNGCGEAAASRVLWVGPTTWRIYLPLVKCCAGEPFHSRVPGYGK